MDSTVRVLATAGVLGVQLVAPLAIGVYEIFVKPTSSLTPAPPRGKARKPAKPAAPVEPEAPALAPLVCAGCGAPVPLLARSFPCPHCGAPVTPPADHVRALELRARRDRMLARAERMWRRSRITSARPTTAVMRLGVLAWAAAVIAASISAVRLGWWGVGFVVFLALILMCVELFVLNALVGVFADGRTQLPPVPPASELRCPPAPGVCAGCAAPIVFARDRLATTCPYCGAESFRAALAQQARTSAAAGADDARAALIDQIRAWQHRRDETLGVFGILAIAEVFYALLAAAVIGVEWFNSL